jgi:hypothetical protein
MRVRTNTLPSGRAWVRQAGPEVAHDPHDEAPICGGAELSASPASAPGNQRNPRGDWPRSCVGGEGERRTITPRSTVRQSNQQDGKISRRWPNPPRREPLTASAFPP